MDRLFIYGSGSTGCELIDSINRIQQMARKWSDVVFVDDIREERSAYGVPVVRFDEMLACDEPCECVIALGEPLHRKRLREKLSAAGVALGIVIDPTATISPTAKIGRGCIIGVGSFVSSNTCLGENVMVEINTVVGHDIVVGQDSVISSGTVVGGHSTIGETSFIGLNSTIKERLRIGDRCIVGMGSSVFSSIDDGLIALGNPARVVKRNEEGYIFKA